MGAERGPCTRPVGFAEALPEEEGMAGLVDADCYADLVA